MNRAIRVLSIVDIVLAVVFLDIVLTSDIFSPIRLSFFILGGDLTAVLGHLLVTNGRGAGILDALVIALAVLVTIDASRRHRWWWFVTLLVLTLILSLAPTIYEALILYGGVVIYASQAGLFDLVVGAMLPLLIALNALVYTFGPAQPAAEPGPGGSAMRRAIQVLASVALVVLGVPGVINLLGILGVSVHGPGDVLATIYFTQGPPLDGIASQLPDALVVAVGVLAMVDASIQHRRRWLILLIVLTSLAVLVVGINGIVAALGAALHPTFDAESFVRHQVYFDSVVVAAVVVTLLVPLASLIFTLRAAPVEDSEPVVAAATKPPAASQP